MALICFTVVISCTTQRAYKTSVVTDTNLHSTYDDTTLLVDNTSILMPYNRFIDPAGTVIRFGNPSLENHSLDCALIPGQNVLVVEDRYGLAFVDIINNLLLAHLDYSGSYNGMMSTYSGIKVWKEEAGSAVHIFWGAANPSNKRSVILDALWDGKTGRIVDAIPFEPVSPSPLALPNDIAIKKESGETYLYVVLNGNSQLVKLRLKDKKVIWTVATGMAPFGLALTSDKIYVTNWAGPVPVDSSRETAGIPYARVYIDPRTGATAMGTVTVFEQATGNKQTEITVGLHPNAIIPSKDQQFIYVSNGNSDNISVISTENNTVVDSISVRLGGDVNSFIGDSPNALVVDSIGTTLYVANGMDNAVAVLKLGSKSATEGKGNSYIEGFIPTEAYPSGLVLSNNTLYVANLEGEGARAAEKNKTYTSHRQEGTISIIPLPDKNTLRAYSTRVEKANMVFRGKISQLLPRPGVAARPVPERIGEPSVFKHVIYIIKENKTYDQVMGDMPEGNGMPSLCIFGDTITPNQHRLAKDFLLLDNYYASGKSSAEGHQWTDAAMVSDYVEKNVRAWFRSYPHVQTDALVYNKEGFIWNNALDHGKSVRIYGEACVPQWKGNTNWKDIYQLYLEKKPFAFENVTTISRVRPILCPTYPCYDGQKINDQIRADAFIKELKEFEKMEGDQWPQLIILALPSDHTAGMREGYPTPRAMVADNDLALGRIIEAVSHSRFWDSTAVFVTEDDSQSGWDHVSGYRTTGFILSPYSRLKKTVHTNYNQTCMVRTIEQILGIPPMNAIDATALPMFDGFTGTFDNTGYSFLKNNIPLDEMNKSATALSGKARQFTMLSSSPQFDHVDRGDDDLLNRIIWFSVKGNTPYPKNMTLPLKLRKDDDD
ncbi:MAG: bifunctional YncE family protein/alkaline phosphatase family protein [Chitinophagaceae bacterium]